MKLSSSTLGCLEWDLPTIVERFRAYGFDAIDFRGMRGNLKLWELPEFTADAAASAARIRDAGLEVSCISASPRLVWQTEQEREDAREEIARTVELCGRLGVPQIRVFGGAIPGGLGRSDALARARASLAAWLALTAGTDVQLAVETHDAWTTSEHALSLIEGADPARVGLCWDTKHTYWAGDETPAYTWGRIRERVLNTHWKDTLRDHATGKDRLCPMGAGVLPLADFVDVLQAGGYAGYYTLEWEKRWHPYLADAEVAFPGFVREMGRLRELLANAGG